MPRRVTLDTPRDTIEFEEGHCTRRSAKRLQLAELRGNAESVTPQATQKLWRLPECAGRSTRLREEDTQVQLRVAASLWHDVAGREGFVPRRHRTDGHRGEDFESHARFPRKAQAAAQIVACAALTHLAQTIGHCDPTVSRQETS